MAGLTAEQIIERIAYANGAEPAVMRQQIDQTLQNMIADTTQPHSFMLADLFPGWEWDGEGYWNLRLHREKQ